MYAEETEGNLEKAIGIYQQVIDKAGEIQRLAARATYQLGMCYLKKGDKDKAAQYFQQVVSDYSTMSTLARKAEKQLKKVSSETKNTLSESFEKGTGIPQGWEKGQEVNGVEYIWDKKNGSDGKASLCLKKTVKKYFPIAQWTRRISHNTNASNLSVSAQVKADNVAKAIIDALFLDQNDKWIKHEWVSYIGENPDKDIPPANHNWKEYSGTVDIPDNTKTIVIGLQMYGPGTVWFDELKVAYLKKPDKAPSKQDKLQAEELCAQGWKLWGQRKLDQAEEIFKQALEKDPTCENAYQGLGWAQLNQGKRMNAKNSFEKCIRLNPQNSAALNGLGWIAHGQGNIDEAIQWWEKAVEVSGGHATASLSGLTQVYMEKKEYDQAIKYYEMWLSAEPNNKQAKNGLEKAKKLRKN